MQIAVNFSGSELDRLYLTYVQNPVNYQKIKTTIIGADAKTSYKQIRKSGFFFFGAVTFIIAVSSSFSMIAEHWDSFIALWMIWGITFVLLCVWLVLLYKNTTIIYNKNNAFFEQFEATIQQSNSLIEFQNNWKSTI